MDETVLVTAAGARQIAHGAVAESLAVATDRAPGHLAGREGPICDRVEENRDGW